MTTSALKGVALCAALSLGSVAALAQADPAAQGSPTGGSTAAAEEEREKHPILFYLPNRIFDLLDVVRARVRLGPGVAVNARFTEVLSLNAGAYGSVFVGIPGPRGEARPNLPLGVENYAGAGISVASAETEDLGPGYGPFEVGAGFQAALVGLDLGVDPLELIDLVTGFLFIDIRDDDF